MNDFELLFLKWFLDRISNKLAEVRTHTQTRSPESALMSLGDVESDVDEMLEVVRRMMDAGMKGG